MTHMIGRPRVRVNQLGYVPGWPKRATWISDAEGSVPFAVWDQSGSVIYTGRSEPWTPRAEPTSGLSVHVLDFTELEVRDGGLWIAVGSERSNRFEVSNRLYDHLTVDALRFFYLMRSGTRILDSIAPGYGRPAGHAAQPP